METYEKRISKTDFDVVLMTLEDYSATHTFTYNYDTKIMVVYAEKIDDMVKRVLDSLKELRHYGWIDPLE